MAGRKTTSKRLRKQRLVESLPKTSLSEVFAKSPLAKVKIDLEREPDYGREVCWSSVHNFDSEDRSV